MEELINITVETLRSLLDFGVLTVLFGIAVLIMVIIFMFGVLMFDVMTGKYDVKKEVDNDNKS
jgi:hypothetical protein